MEFSELGFADITPEPEKTLEAQYLEAYHTILGRRQKGELTPVEWLDLWLALSEEYDMPINPRLLSLPWITEHLNKVNPSFLPKNQQHWLKHDH